MKRIGLVLGAGGVAGHAFHAGVLAALSERTGWDPRHAEIVVGTSAGSLVAALLRAGLSPKDLLARELGWLASPEGVLLMSRLGPHAAVPGSAIRALPRSLRPASPRLLASLTVGPWRARPGTMVAALLPAGRISTDPVVAGLRNLHGKEWPERATWICTVRLEDGRRVVFGRPGSPEVDMATAVACSCAIPGVYRPVVVNGSRYVDGGAYSATNADLLAGLDLDLVVVSSPMSVERGQRARSLDIPLRLALAARLARESARVRRRGTAVVTFEPSREELEVIGLDAMKPGRRRAVAHRSWQSALRRLDHAALIEQLAPLTA